jgi:CBS domain-containing protein
MHAIRHVIRPHRLVTAPPTASVLEVARVMTDARVGAIPIVEGERIVGIFSERDLMTRIVVEGRDPQRALVLEVMSREVQSATPDDTRSECLERMREARCRHLPVLENGRLIAMLSMRDLLRDEIEEQDEEIRGLRAYLHQAPS